MKVTFLFSIGLLVLGQLSAQIAEETQVSFSFNCYLVGSQAKGVSVTEDPDFRREQIYYYLDEGVAQPIRLVPGIRSKNLRYSGPVNFTLFEQKLPTEPGEEVQYLPVASGKVGVGVKQVLFVLIKSGSGSLSILPLDLDLSVIKSGYAHFFNLSRSPLVCSVGSEKFQLAPLSGRNVNLTPVGKDLQLSIQCAARDSDDWELVYSGSQTVKKNKRYLFLLSPIGTQNRFRLIRFKL